MLKRRKQEWKENIRIYMLCIWKKIRDSKIRTKLIIYLILVAIISSFAVGGVSYVSMREALIENAQHSAISLLKQKGERMDERIYDYQNATYSLSQKEDIYHILESEEKSRLQQITNQSVFNGTLLLYSMIHQYSDFVLMESLEEEIYLYNRAGTKEKLEETRAKELLSRFRDEVTETTPIKWIKHEDRIYFIRRVIRLGDSNGLQSIGTMIFSISETFFRLGEKESPYVSDHTIVMANPAGEIYKKSELPPDEAALARYLSYNGGKYYIYTITQKIAKEKFLVIPLRTAKYRFNIVCFIPYAIIMEKADLVIWRVLATMAILLSAGLFIAFSFHRMLRKNLRIIENGMRQFEKGDYMKRLSPSSYDEIGLLILQFNHMGVKISELNELTRKEQEEKEKLQYLIMEAQINPHFLYNTLGSLKWLAYEKGQEEIAKLADAIINLLRFTVKHTNKRIPLHEEIDYIRYYIYIQKARYEETFIAQISITKEAEDFLITGFILQPFIENSILHGLDNSKKDGRIQISGEVKKDELCLLIQDNGIGMTQEKLKELQGKLEENQTEQSKGFNGVGIANVIVRMKMIYGKAFQYQIESKVGQGTEVRLRIPRCSS